MIEFEEITPDSEFKTVKDVMEVLSLCPPEMLVGIGHIQAAEDDMVTCVLFPVVGSLRVTAIDNGPDMLGLFCMGPIGEEEVEN